MSLSEVILRTINERGSILKVTEESLLAEIALEDGLELELKTGPVETDDNPANEEENAIVDSLTPEEFAIEKEEILKLLRSALNESSLSLDFISLLISCVRPAAGSISMSPLLKQHVPMGTLNSALVEILELDKEAKKQELETEAKVGQGWKLQSLEYSAEILKKSSSRLKEEILKEKEYWNNISNIVKSNEVLVKMNTNNATTDIGVKFGFGDSGSNYFDKGIGILKKNVKNGKIEFRPVRNNNIEKSSKIVKVKVLKRIDNELKTISESNIRDIFECSVPVDDDSIGSEISKARFFLFEEELFHELVKEAITLLPYQVQVINNKIIMEINDEVIEIEAINFEQSEDEMQVDDTTDTTKANYISSFLRLMLSQDFKQNITRKYRTPVPLSRDQRPKVDANRSALLLRPLIGHSKHNSYIKQICKICASLAEKYHNSEHTTKSSIKVVKYYNIDPKEYKANKFIRCTKIPSSRIEFEVESPKDSLKRLRFEISVLNTSNFCNIVMNVKSFVIGQDKKLVDVDFSEFIDVEDSLDWAIKSY